MTNAADPHAAPGPGRAGTGAPQAATHDDLLTISTVRSGGQLAEVAVRGELDLATTGRLGAALSAQIRSDRRFVRLDLGGLTFCDASGLNTLLAAHRACLDANGSLILTGCGQRFLRLLRITGLDRVLTVDPA